MRQKVIYLAGPDVFRPDAVAWGARLKALCATSGAVGLYPLDNLADPDNPDPSSIRAANLAMIERCDAVVANITPFRGPSADAGTTYELGYAAALDKLIVAYSAAASGDYAARVAAQAGAAGAERDGNDMLIETFDPPLTDNLMLACGVDALLADAEMAIRSAVAMLDDADGQPAALSTLP